MTLFKLLHVHRSRETLQLLTVSNSTTNRLGVKLETDLSLHHWWLTLLICVICPRCVNIFGCFDMRMVLVSWTDWPGQETPNKKPLAVIAMLINVVCSFLKYAHISFHPHSFEEWLHIDNTVGLEYRTVNARTRVLFWWGFPNLRNYNNNTHLRACIVRHQDLSIFV